MSYKLIWESKGLLVKHYGTYSISNILFAINEIYGDERFDEINYQIMDLSEVDEITVSADDVDMIVDHEINPLKSNPNVKFVFVSTNKVMPELVVEYKRIGKHLPWEIKLFATLEEAREWISNKTIDQNFQSCGFASTAPQLSWE